MLNVTSSTASVTLKLSHDQLKRCKLHHLGATSSAHTQLRAWPVCQVLEDRFQGLVEGSLAAAFVARRGEQVQQLVAMMVSIGRSATVEKLYNAARLAPLQVETQPLCSMVSM